MDDEKSNESAPIAFKLTKGQKKRLQKKRAANRKAALKNQESNITIKTITIEDNIQSDNMTDKTQQFFVTYLESVLKQETRLLSNEISDASSLSKKEIQALITEVAALESVYSYLREQVCSQDMPDLLIPNSFYATIALRIELVKMKLLNITHALLNQQKVNTHSSIMSYLEGVIYRTYCPPYSHYNQYVTILTTFLKFFTNASYSSKDNFDTWFEHHINDDIYYLGQLHQKSKIQRKAELRNDANESSYKRRNQDVLLVVSIIQSIFGLRLYPQIALGLLCQSVAIELAEQLLISANILLSTFNKNKQLIIIRIAPEIIKDNLYYYTSMIMLAQNIFEDCAYSTGETIPEKISKEIAQLRNRIQDAMFKYEASVEAIEFCSFFTETIEEISYFKTLKEKLRAENAYLEQLKIIGGSTALCPEQELMSLLKTMATAGEIKKIKEALTSINLEERLKLLRKKFYDLKSQSEVHLQFSLTAIALLEELILTAEDLDKYLPYIKDVAALLPLSSHDTTTIKLADINLTTDYEFYRNIYYESFHRTQIFTKSYTVNLTEKKILTTNKAFFVELIPLHESLNKHLSFCHFSRQQLTSICSDIKVISDFMSKELLFHDGALTIGLINAQSLFVLLINVNKLIWRVHSGFNKHLNDLTDQLTHCLQLKKLKTILLIEARLKQLDSLFEDIKNFKDFIISLDQHYSVFQANHPIILNSSDERLMLKNVFALWLPKEEKRVCLYQQLLNNLTQYPFKLPGKQDSLINSGRLIASELEKHLKKLKKELEQQRSSNQTDKITPEPLSLSEIGKEKPNKILPKDNEIKKVETKTCREFKKHPSTENPKTKTIIQSNKSQKKPSESQPKKIVTPKSKSPLSSRKSSYVYPELSDFSIPDPIKQFLKTVSEILNQYIRHYQYGLLGSGVGQLWKGQNLCDLDLYLILQNEADKEKLSLKIRHGLLPLVQFKDEEYMRLCLLPPYNPDGKILKFSVVLLENFNSLQFTYLHSQLFTEGEQAFALSEAVITSLEKNLLKLPSLSGEISIKTEIKNLVKAAHFKGSSHGLNWQTESEKAFEMKRVSTFFNMKELSEQYNMLHLWYLLKDLTHYQEWNNLLSVGIIGGLFVDNTNVGKDLYYPDSRMTCVQYGLEFFIISIWFYLQKAYEYKDISAPLFLNLTLANMPDSEKESVYINNIVKVCEQCADPTAQLCPKYPLPSLRSLSILSEPKKETAIVDESDVSLSF